TMPEHLSSILDSTEPTLLTTGWGRTEGPLWHAAGSVTFVDVAGSRLLRWETSGQVRVVRECTGEGNGGTLDRQGWLLMCEGADHRRITRMDADGTVTTIAAHWQGKADKNFKGLFWRHLLVSAPASSALGQGAERC